MRFYLGDRSVSTSHPAHPLGFGMQTAPYFGVPPLPYAPTGIHPAHALGFGMQTVPEDFPQAQVLRSLPTPLSPADGEEVGLGKVTFHIKNVIGREHEKAKYMFEIEDAKGAREISAPVDPGAKETSWAPKMEIKAGEKYTWRVWVVDGNWKGPVLATEFKGK